MNTFLFDLLPVFLFFIAFKYYGIYAATWVGIITTLLQTSISRLKNKRWDKMQVITLIIFVLFGGMTLYFHDPIFVKWKPTIVFWIFATILFFSHFIGSKPIIQRILEGALQNQKTIQEQRNIPQMNIPLRVGIKLNIAWTLFFIILGSANLYIAYHFNDNVWVNFKLYGITGLTLIFSLLQTGYLMKHLKNN